jgi:phage terminase small subunit
MLTPKQEKFVQAYHKLGSQRKAYRAAYDAKNTSDRVADNKACGLLKRDDIRVRLAELQAKVAAKTEITVETITKMLASSYQKASSAGQHGPATQAAMGLAKVHGLIID